MKRKQGYQKDGITKNIFRMSKNGVMELVNFRKPRCGQMIYAFMEDTNSKVSIVGTEDSFVPYVGW